MYAMIKIVGQVVYTREDGTKMTRDEYVKALANLGCKNAEEMAPRSARMMPVDFSWWMVTDDPDKEN
jgi:hypothetical protein